MRHPIEKLPRDGTAKPTEAVEWVSENGEPEITPTRWHPLARHQYRPREGERSLLAASSFIVILGTATLIATNFSAEVAAYVTRSTGHEVLHIAEQASRSANQGSRKSNLVAQRQAEADQASGPTEAQQAAQVQQIAAVSVSETPQSLMEDRAEGWAQEPTEAQGAIEALDVQLHREAAKSARSLELEEEREKAAALAREVPAARNELAASTEQHRQMLSEKRDRSALASELVTAQWNVETRVVQSNRTTNGGAQLKAAVSVASSELQGERERPETLASELEKVRREAEAAAELSSRKYDEAVQQRQTVEVATASLQPSLQHDGDRTEAMARDFASVPHTMDEPVAVGSSPESHPVQVTQTVKTAATEPLKATEVQGNVEAAKLIARARVLLGQGNIGAARVVLERAAESGNAQASFMLAETYDSVILSAWGTFGTRGETAKAREHYAKAHAGGIREAKDRLDVLRQ